MLALACHRPANTILGATMQAPQLDMAGLGMHCAVVPHLNQAEAKEDLRANQTRSSQDRDTTDDVCINMSENKNKKDNRKESVINQTLHFRKAIAVYCSLFHASKV